MGSQRGSHKDELILHQHPGTFTRPAREKNNNYSMSCCCQLTFPLSWHIALPSCDFWRVRVWKKNWLCCLTIFFLLFIVSFKETHTKQQQQQLHSLRYLEYFLRLSYWTPALSEQRMTTRWQPSLEMKPGNYNKTDIFPQKMCRNRQPGVCVCVRTKLFHQKHQLVQQYLLHANRAAQPKLKDVAASTKLLQ